MTKTSETPAPPQPTEQPLELKYTVTVRTFGKTDKVRDDIGRALAKAVRLKLGKNTVVRSGRQTFVWNPSIHGYGTPSDILIDDLADEESVVVVETASEEN